MVLNRKQFGDDDSTPDTVPQDWVDQKKAEDLSDSMIRAVGYADWDHYRTAVRNERDTSFFEHYPDAVYDEDRDRAVLHLRHPSGWRGVHTGLYTEMVPPGRSDAVDAVNWNDYSKGGFGSDPSEQWPQAYEVRARFNQWVDENRDNPY